MIKTIHSRPRTRDTSLHLLPLLTLLLVTCPPTTLAGQDDCKKWAKADAAASFFLPQSGGKQTLQVDIPAGRNWSVGNPSNVQWLKFDIDPREAKKATIIVTAEPNMTSSCRLASLSISGVNPWYPLRVDIWQAGLPPPEAVTVIQLAPLASTTAKPEAKTTAPTLPQHPVEQVAKATAPAQAQPPLEPVAKAGAPTAKTEQVTVAPKPVPPQAAAPSKPTSTTAPAVVSRQTVSPATPPTPQPTKIAGSKPKKIKIHGYVTEVVSPAVFEIEDYRITRDASFRLEFENDSPETTFKIEDVRIGTELEIEGLFYADTGELKAESIKVDMDQFRKFKQTAIIHKPPEGVTKSGAGWTGTFFADGQRITVLPTTKVVFKLTKSESKTLKEQEKEKKKNNSKEDEGADGESPDEVAGEFRPLDSLDEVVPGMIMSYEGYRNIEDGTITADRVEFMHNEFTKGKAHLWKDMKATVKPGDASAFKPGELRISSVGKFKLHPSEELQSYVQNLGMSLVPKPVLDVPDSDPSKIRFNFYVVIDKDANAFAVPNGNIIVNSGLLDLVENEAQLSSVLAHEEAHVVQEHAWQQMQYHRKKRMLLAIGGAVAAAYGYQTIADIATMIEAAIRNGYSRSLENQADREGLQQIVSAGYDPREAPRFWKVVTQAYGLQVTDFFWSSHDNHATRRSYLMNEIRNNYSSLDFSTLRKGDDSSFQAIKQIARSGATKKQTIKVKT